MPKIGGTIDTLPPLFEYAIHSNCIIITFPVGPKHSSPSRPSIYYYTTCVYVCTGTRAPLRAKTIYKSQPTRRASQASHVSHEWRYTCIIPSSIYVIYELLYQAGPIQTNETSGEPGTRVTYWSHCRLVHLNHYKTNLSLLFSLLILSLSLAAQSVATCHLIK